RLSMNGYGIVNARLDLMGGEVPAERIPARRAHDVLVVDMRPCWISRRHGDPGAEPLIVVLCDGSPATVAGVEQAELHPQHRGLELVEPAVRAIADMLVLRGLPVRPEQAHASRERGDVGPDQAGVPVGGEVLHYPQAEGADGAEGPHPPPVERCAVSVRAVLDEDEVARPREREDRAEVDRQAIE